MNIFLSVWFLGCATKGLDTAVCATVCDTGDTTGDTTGTTGNTTGDTTGTTGDTSGDTTGTTTTDPTGTTTDTGATAGECGSAPDCVVYACYCGDCNPDVDVQCVSAGWAEANPCLLGCPVTDCPALATTVCDCDGGDCVKVP